MIPILPHLEILPSPVDSEDTEEPIVDYSGLLPDFSNIRDFIRQQPSPEMSESALQRSLIYLSNAYPANLFRVTGKGTLYIYTQNSIAESPIYTFPNFSICNGRIMCYTSTLAYEKIENIGLSIVPDMAIDGIHTESELPKPIMGTEISEAVFIPYEAEVIEDVSIDKTTAQDLKFTELINIANHTLKSLVKSREFINSDYYRQVQLLEDHITNFKEKLNRLLVPCLSKSLGITAHGFYSFLARTHLETTDDENVFISCHIVKITSELLSILLANPNSAIKEPEDDELILTVDVKDSLTTGDGNYPVKLKLSGKDAVRYLGDPGTIFDIKAGSILSIKPW